MISVFGIPPCHRAGNRGHMGSTALQHSVPLSLRHEGTHKHVGFSFFFGFCLWDIKQKPKKAKIKRALQGRFIDQQSSVGCTHRCKHTHCIKRILCKTKHSSLRHTVLLSAVPAVSVNTGSLGSTVISHCLNYR